MDIARKVQGAMPLYVSQDDSNYKQEQERIVQALPIKEEKSRVLADLEYLEYLLSVSTPEELIESSSSIFNLSMRNIGKIKGTPNDVLKDRYINLVNNLLKYLPVANDSLNLQQGVKEKTTDLLKYVGIDASTICQLRCKSCSFQKKNYHYLGRGFLTFANFKVFLDNNNYIKGIELSNYGEIFLNPELEDIIRYAFEKGVKLYALNGVNFNTVTDEVIEALVKYQFESISFSIDGACQEIYSIYRINGNFDTVINNIQRLNEYKLKYQSLFPKLKWQYVIMEHNENDVIKAKKMAQELGMELCFKLTWVKGYIPKNVEMLRKETGLEYFNRETVLKGTGKPYRNYYQCRKLYNNPNINWDGRLLGCSCNVSVDFGVNVFEIGLAEALNSPNYRYAKDMLRGKVGVPENAKNIPCINCYSYKLMCETGTFLTDEE